MTLIVAAFLVVHGLVHLAVWLPHPAPTEDKAEPFDPRHSAVLTRATVPVTTTGRLASSLAVLTAAAFTLAGLLVALGADAAVPVAVAAAVIGLVLKALFFNPWLSFGVLLDVLVLVAALGEWPVRVA